MNEFIMAALPWIFGGLTIALYMAMKAHTDKRFEAGKLDAEGKRKMISCMTKNMCVGMVLGFAMGINGIRGISVFLGITGGLFIGLLLGTVMGFAGRE